MGRWISYYGPVCLGYRTVMANNDGGNAEGPIFKPNCSRKLLMGDMRESQKLSRMGRQAPKSELTKEFEG